MDDFSAQLEWLNFLVTPEFQKYWDMVLKIAVYAFAGAAVLSYIIYKILLLSQGTPKAKYDFLVKHELTALKFVAVFFGLSVGSVVNLLGEKELNIAVSTFFIHLGVSVIATGAAIYLPLMYFRLRYPKTQAKKLNKYRYAPRINPASGNKMKLLSEEEEDAYLDPGKQAEEETFSVDYDVWLDEETGDTVVERYEGRLLASKCVSCGFQTLRLQTEDLLSAEETEDGREQLVRRYDCSFCNHQESKTVYVTRSLDKARTADLEQEAENVRVDILEKGGGVRSYEFPNVERAAAFLNEIKSHSGASFRDPRKSQEG